MSEHHHHHHHKDGASRFKERSLNAIVFRQKAEKWLKIVLCIVAAMMVMSVIFVYILG